MQTDVNSLDVNIDVHPQLEFLPVLDHKDLQGGLLLTNHLETIFESCKNQKDIFIDTTIAILLIYFGMVFLLAV